MSGKFNFTKSEQLFTLLGIGLILASAILLIAEFSFISKDIVVEADPFQSTYSSIILPAATPVATPLPLSASPSPSINEQAVTQKIPTPAPVATPIAAPSETPQIQTPLQALQSRQKVFLLYPSSHAFLTNTRNNTNGYPLKLKFEVEPKDTVCKLELQHAEQIVLTKELKGSPSGFYEVSLLIKKPGLYLWRVTTPRGGSELREFVIKSE